MVVRTLLLVFSFVLALPALADVRIEMRDGTVYTDVTGFREYEDFFLGEYLGQTLTANKNRVARVVRDGDVLWEALELTARKMRLPDGQMEFSFFRNNEFVGRGKWNRDGIFEVLEGTIPDGTYLQYHDSGKLQRTLPFEDGQLHGQSVAYFESGIVEKEGTFVDGREEGVSKLYYKDGTLRGESTYHEGVRHGETRLYHPSGKIQSRMSFDDGVAEGLQQMFYPSGALEVEVLFRNGERHGPIRQYFESGKLKMEGEFDAGRLDGEVVIYYESGRVKNRRYFDEGRLLEGEG